MPATFLTSYCSTCFLRYCIESLKVWIFVNVSIYREESLLYLPPFLSSAAVVTTAAAARRSAAAAMRSVLGNLAQRAGTAAGASTPRVQAAASRPSPALVDPTNTLKGSAQRRQNVRGCNKSFQPLHGTLKWSLPHRLLCGARVLLQYCESCIADRAAP